KEESEARIKAADAAIARLDELAGEDWVRPDTVERLRGLMDFRRNRFAARFSADDDSAIEERSQAYQRLLRELFNAERAAVLQLRRERKINDDVMARVTRDIDLEDARLDVEEALGCLSSMLALPMSTLTDLMTKDVLTVAPEGTIGEAAQKMVDREVSSAAVSDYGRLIGILTERDLTPAVAGRTHSSEARVREWMTPDPVTLPASASPREAAEIMLEQRFRHIPVVEGDRAIGIVSIRDVARWSVEEED